jgi:hypothetical protein
MYKLDMLQVRQALYQIYTAHVRCDDNITISHSERLRGISQLSLYRAMVLVNFDSVSEECVEKDELRTRGYERDYRSSIISPEVRLKDIIYSSDMILIRHYHYHLLRIVNRRSYVEIPAVAPFVTISSLAVMFSNLMSLHLTERD